MDRAGAARAVRGEHLAVADVVPAAVAVVEGGGAVGEHVPAVVGAGHRLAGDGERAGREALGEQQPVGVGRAALDRPVRAVDALAPRAAAPAIEAVGSMAVAPAEARATRKNPRRSIRASSAAVTDGTTAGFGRNRCPPGMDAGVHGRPHRRAYDRRIDGWASLGVST